MPIGPRAPGGPGLSRTSSSVRANESARRCSAFMSARLLFSDLAKADVRELHFAVSPFSLPSLPLKRAHNAESVTKSSGAMTGERAEGGSRQEAHRRHAGQ
jgi:hypothetical protein